MDTRPYRILLASIAIIAFITLLPWLGEIGFATDGAPHGDGLPRPVRTLSPISGTAQITITTAGFDPAVLTVTVGTQVTWYNATTTTHTLNSAPYYVAPGMRLRDAR